MLHELRALIMQARRHSAANFSSFSPSHVSISFSRLSAPRAPFVGRTCLPLLPNNTIKLSAFKNTLNGNRLPRSIQTKASAKEALAANREDDRIPFNDYSPEANAAYWATRPVSVMKRMLEVGSTLGTWVAVGQIGGTIPRDRADKLREILSNLGPTFIKIGQAVSSRPDTLPPEFLRELEKLQDRLPPFPTDQALAVMEEDLGRPVSEVFSQISDIPVAAASLGQVYRARLRRDGSEVAVKVQRPGVKTSIALDVLVLRQLLVYVKKFRNFNSDLPGLLDEWATSLFKELDYRQEAANGVKFKELYSHLDGVYVPDMVTDLTTARVLVMEWVDGDRLRTAYSAVGGGGSPGIGSIGATSDAYDFPPRSGSEDDIRLVEIGVKCSLEQLLEFGYFHGDPHPGNLLRTRDGKLAYLDFGMMGSVDESIRQGLIRATLHLVNREYEALADDFVTLGMLPSNSDKAKIVPALTGVFAEALAGGVNNLSFGTLSANLGRTMYEFNFQIPSYFTLLVRSLSVLEGIALSSDPNYKVLGAAYPWVARRLLTDTTPELRATLTSLLYKNGKFNFKRMESLLTQAARPTGRPPRRRDDPEGFDQPRGDALALILSPQGDFVRGIVVEELAKGADAAWRLAIDTAVAEAMTELVGSNYGDAGENRNGIPSSSAPSGPFLGALVDVLATLPRLSDDEDVEQVRGLRSLGVALQSATVAQREADQQRSARGGAPAASNTWIGGLAGNSDSDSNNTSDAYSAKEQNFCASAAANIETAAALLQWAVREAETLDPAARAEALKLPVEVAQQAVSRVIARGVRWVLAEEPPAEAAEGTSI
jgi:aarF domain-containing kinase